MRKLKYIEADAAAATKGPWAPSNSTGNLDETHNVFRGESAVHHAGRIAAVMRLGPGGYADAKFIALARTDVPEMAAEIRRLRELAQKWILAWRDNAYAKDVSETAEKALAEIEP